MLLTAKELIDKGIIIPSEYSKEAQVGIDLSLASVHKCEGGSVVYKDSTHIDPMLFEEVETQDVDGTEMWVLGKGVYAITFNEGCNVPANAAGFIIHRSSLYRTGNSIVSPIWDPGFATEKMGTVLVVNERLLVEKNARVAQMYFIQTTTNANLYDGQYQGGTHSWEKKRTKKK